MTGGTELPSGTKDELERKKLQREIRDLDRPFWRRHGFYFGAAPAVAVIVSTVVAVTTLVGRDRDAEYEERERRISFQLTEMKTKNYVMMWLRKLFTLDYSCLTSKEL